MTPSTGNLQITVLKDAQRRPGHAVLRIVGVEHALLNEAFTIRRTDEPGSLSGTNWPAGPRTPLSSEWHEDSQTLELVVGPDVVNPVVGGTPVVIRLLGLDNREAATLWPDGLDLLVPNNLRRAKVPKEVAIPIAGLEDARGSPPRLQKQKEEERARQQLAQEEQERARQKLIEEEQERTRQKLIEEAQERARQKLAQEEQERARQQLSEQEQERAKRKFVQEKRERTTRKPLDWKAYANPPFIIGLCTVLTVLSVAIWPITYPRHDSSPSPPPPVHKPDDPPAREDLTFYGNVSRYIFLARRPANCSDNPSADWDTAMNHATKEEADFLLRCVYWGKDQELARKARQALDDLFDLEYINDPSIRAPIGRDDGPLP